ncbi:hypothetical protein BS78_08G135800 [Paspalum vaginatum]|nr:hypothetical protein BS78_08G135800 [Paspalum vaginatum]
MLRAGLAPCMPLFLSAHKGNRAKSRPQPFRSSARARLRSRSRSTAVAPPTPQSFDSKAPLLWTAGGCRSKDLLCWQPVASDAVLGSPS